MGWTPSVAIIGAGVGGICMAIQLRERLGITDFTIYEKEGEVGGTWLVNSYPGCACDIASHMYCFSFALNPNWSKKYAGAKEILAYLKEVVDKYEIRQNIKFNTEVGKTEWDNERQEWHLTIKRNNKVEDVTYNILIVGSGPLRIPNIPDRLISNFEGAWVHTAKWPEDLDLANKNVAVIGNGASAVQIIPKIAAEVNQLYIYQRTPSWVLWKHDPPYSESWKRILRWSPKINRLYRWALFARNEITHRIFRRNYPLSWLVTRIAQGGFKQFLKWQVPVASLRNALTPNYEPGCKRVILASDYYPTFLRPNVHLITEGISEISGSTICSGEGTQTKVDAIVLATGFRPDLFIAPMKMVGKRGREIAEVWEKERPQAYYGFCCSEFPNAFILLGPNSALGHNSVIFQTECQVDAIVKLIGEMMEKDIASIDVKIEVQSKFNEELQRDLTDTVWASGGCKSWYYSDQGNYTLWPHSCIEFWRQTRQITINAFDVVKR